MRTANNTPSLATQGQPIDETGIFRMGRTQVFTTMQQLEEEKDQEEEEN
jgi:hypothetical protein